MLVLAPTLVYDLGDHSQLFTAMAAFLPWELVLEIPQPFWGTETENQFTFMAHAFTLSCPTPGPDCPHIYNSGVLALGDRLHKPLIFLFISLSSTDTWPTSQCVQKQKWLGWVYLKKKKKEEAGEFTSFERLCVGL